MAGTRKIVFDGNSLLKLLTHYTQDSADSIPLDGELVDCGVSARLGQWIGLLVRSANWDGPVVPSGDGLRPLHIRYEGKRVMTWKQDGSTNNPEWKPSVESPYKP